MPEDLDVSEIDKLTGIPKPGGKFLCLIKSVRLTTIRHSNARSLHDDKHFQVQSQSSARYAETRQSSKDDPRLVCCSGRQNIPSRAAIHKSNQRTRNDDDVNQQLQSVGPRSVKGSDCEQAGEKEKGQVMITLF